jgi:hypothetical protein
MWTEIFFRYEPAGLSEDCAARSRVQFLVCRDREGLGCVIGKHPSQFDVASSLGVDRETEAAEDCNDLRA